MKTVNHLIADRMAIALKLGAIWHTVSDLKILRNENQQTLVIRFPDGTINTTVTFNNLI